MFKPVQNVQSASLRGVSCSESVAVSNARRSVDLMGLMKSQNIALECSEVLDGGLMIVDATKNPTNAYKVRGALASVYEAVSQNYSSVVAASAGNHGAGVAYAAKCMAVEAVIYVPENAPKVKVRAISDFRAEVVPAGANFDQCSAIARQNEEVLAGRAKFLHAFNSEAVVAGQGTIGVELVEHLSTVLPNSDFERVRVFLPVGGGGLAAGVSSAMKVLWPFANVELEIVGVVDESVPASLLGIMAGRPIAYGPHTIADGIRVRLIGERFLEVSHLVDHLLKVRHDDIVSAMKNYHHATNVRLEGAGALALAGESFSQRHKLFNDGKRTLNLALVTGRNVDSSTFEGAVQAAPRLDPLVYTRQAFDVLIPEQKGELRHFLKTVREFNIAGLTYKQKSGASAGHLRVEFEVERERVNELAELINREFPGSDTLDEGHQMLFEVGDPLAAEFEHELIELSDEPGSFSRYVEKASSEGSFGSVGFVFYQKPPSAGLVPQVVLGRSLKD